MRGWRDPRGVTLVEVALCLIILAVLAASVIPAMGNLLALTRAHGAADQIAAGLRLGRLYAISNFATYTVTLTNTSVAVSCTASCPPNAPAEPVTTLIHGATASAASITFGPLGTATPASSLTVMYSAAPPWLVEVTEAGRIRTCTPTCA